MFGSEFRIVVEQRTAEYVSIPDSGSRVRILHGFASFSGPVLGQFSGEVSGKTELQRPQRYLQSIALVNLPIESIGCGHL